MARTPTQRARVAESLLHEIKEGRYPLGAKLPSERLLADRFGVSRPVVREALGILSTMDVVEVQMGRGAFVTNADVSTTPASTSYGLVDIVDAREAIESGALRLSVNRARRQERAAVERALKVLEKAVKDNAATSEADLALHRSITEASRSSLLIKLWLDMTEEVAQTIQVSPHGTVMSEEILEQHRVLARGVTHGEATPALAACARLYDDHRAFLRSLLG